MAENLGSATLRLSTDDRGLKQGLKGAEGTTRRGMGALTKIAIAGGVAAAAGFGAKMLQAGAEIEHAFAEVRTLLPTIGDEAFGALQADVLAFTREMNVSTDQAIPALYQAISAGVPAENVVDFLTIASKAATGGVTDLETAVDGITSVVNAYGEETISAQEASDLMFTAVRLGKTDFQQLSARLFNVVPLAAALGVGFEEVAAGMAVMTAQGVPTAQATTMMRQMFTEASKTGTDLADAILELTGKSLPDLIKEGKPVHEVLSNLRESMPEQEFRDLFSSVEAANAAFLLTGPNAEAMDDALLQMQNSAGATDKAFETMAATARFKVGRAINWLRVTMAQWGEKGLQVLVKIVEDEVIPAFNKMTAWFRTNRVLIHSFWKAILAVGRTYVEWVQANIVPVIVTAFTAISTWVENNRAGITGFFYAMKRAATALVNYFRTSFTLVKTALEALFNILRPQLDEGTGDVGKFFTNIVAWATVAVDWYTEYITKITDALQGITDWINENPEVIQGWFDTAKEAVKTAIAAIEGSIAWGIAVFQSIGAWLEQNKEPISAWFETAKTHVDAAIKAIEGAVNWMVLVIGGIRTWLDENKETISYWFEQAKAGLQTAITAIEIVIGWIPVAIESLRTWLEQTPETLSGWFNTAKAEVERVINEINAVVGTVTWGILSVQTWLQQFEEPISAWFERAKTAVEGVINTMTPIIGKVVDKVAEIVQWITDNPEVIQGWIEKAWNAAAPYISYFQTGLGVWAGIFIALKNAVVSFAQYIWAEHGESILWFFGKVQEWGKWLINNEVVMAAVFGAIAGAILAALGPLTIAGLIIAGLITAAGYIKEEWGTLENFFNTLWAKIETTFKEKWDAIVAWVLNPFYNAGNVITQGWGAIEQWFVDMWNNVGLTFAIAWQAILNLLFPTPSYAEQIKSAWGNIVDSIAGIFTDAGNAAIQVLNKLVEMMNTALKKWNDLSFSIQGFSKTFKAPAWLGGKSATIGWDGITLDTPNIPLVSSLPQFSVPGLAEGGIVTAPMLAMVGEGGQDEAVIPLPEMGRLGGLTIQVENAYGIDNLVDQINEAWLDGRLRGLQDQLAGVG